MNQESKMSRAFVALLVVTGIFPLPAFANSGCDSPPSGIVSWWKGESNATDIVGGNNGTLVNNAGYTAGEVGSAFFFTNALAAVQLGSPTNLQLQSLTVEAWIKRASGTSVTFDASGDAEIFGFGSQGYAFGMHSDGTLFVTKNDVDGVDASVAISDTGFHHVALTTTGTAVVFYVDGVAYAAGNYTSAFQFTTGAAIGARGDNLANSFYGAIDEISVYDRALQAAEIQGIFNAGAFGKCPLPQILTQPVNQSVSVGSQVQFLVVAQATNALTYQWTFDGTNLPPATNATLTLTDVQVAQAGSYAVIVSNQYAGVVSVTATLTVNVTPPCVPSPANLVSWWPANGYPQDIAGGNNGALTGSASYAPGEVGQGFIFNAIGAAVNVGTAPNLQLQNFTIEAWIKRTSASFLTLDPQGDAPVFAFGSGGYALYITGTGDNLALSQEYVSGVSSSAVVSGTNWHHVAVTKNGGTVIFYLDGIAYAVPSYNPAFTFTTPASIGATGGTQANSFYGQIDELAIYSRPLSSAEINSIYTAGAGGKCLLAVSAQPASLSAYIGGSATFAAQVVGRQPINYQWSFNTTNIPGATNGTLVLTNLQISNVGSYTVTVLNPDSAAVSSNAVLTVRPAPPCITAPSNLVAWWKGDGNALDELGAINGTPAGAVSYGNGEVNQAFQFGGVGAAVNVGSPTNLQLQNFTIEAWIKRASTNFLTLDTSGGTDGEIFDWATGGYGFLIYTSGNILTLSQVGYSGAFSTATVTDLNWHHVAVTRSGGTVVFYLDGVAYPYGTYNPTFTFTGQASIGAVGSSQLNSFYGSIDELAIYNRALTAAEIGAIYTNAVGGKCPVAYPPNLVFVPASQSVALHGSTSFTVSAAGTIPLSYQWLLDGTNLPGATNPVLPLTSIQFNQAGSYSVTVSNSVNSVTSTNAILGVVAPTVPIRVTGTNAVAGSVATIPVTISANGLENSLQFTLTFVPTNLSYAGTILGSGLTNATLVINTNVARYGEVGIGIFLPSGATFAPIAQEVVRISFLVAPVTNLSLSTPVGFGNNPVAEQLSDPNFNPLPASYTAGTITISGTAIVGGSSFEGDANGDGHVTLGDWLEVGQFVAHLAATTSTSQFQRADSAPRATLGDADITVIDWVQAGRYALGLDPLTAAGGPTTASGNGTAVGSSSSRLLSVSSPTVQIGLTNVASLAVNMAAQGNENAAGFTVSFPTANFTFNGASAGSGLGAATLLLNTNQIGAGLLGVALALPPGSTFPNGNLSLLSLNLALVGTNSGNSTISLGSQFVKAEVSDVFANPLPLGLNNGIVTVNPIPSLAIAYAGTNVVVSWPLWASNFSLQYLNGVTLPFTPWSNLPAGVTAMGSNFVTLPSTNASQLFRLDLP